MAVHDQLVEVATRCAHDILALPAEEREATYEALHAEHLVKAKALGLPDEAAEELVEQMESAVKRLVAMIPEGTWHRE